MKHKLCLTSIILSIFAVAAHAMDYGLRFNSHSFPGSMRTSLKLGADRDFKFSNNLAIEFELSFYDTPHFGQICTIELDNGSSISLVSAVNDNLEYNPAIIIDGKLHVMPSDFIADTKDPAKIGLSVDKESGTVTFRYGGETISENLLKTDMNAASITFGSTENQPAVAPADMRDIKVFIDNRNTNHWELAKHDGDMTYDCISDVAAEAKNPNWIIDGHFKWKKVFGYKTDENIQTAFNPESSVFYILSDSRLKIFNPVTGIAEDIDIPADRRVMMFSNHLAFAPLSNSLISYNLKQLTSSRLDLNSFSWSGAEKNTAEPYFHNHSFASDGKNAYTFGGYGFYLFNNSSFKIDLVSGEVSPVRLNPLPESRTSSSSAIVGDKLYIFGGFGNIAGKQEIPAVYYYDLWEYDLNTFEGKKIWEIENVDQNFIPSSSMYFSIKENAFYMASTLNGGNMIKISLDRPGYEVVSESIFSKMDYRDFVFDLFRNDTGDSYYLVLDKHLSDSSHEYAIYEISYPFADNPSYKNLGGDNPGYKEEATFASRNMLPFVAGIIISAIAIFVAIIFKGNKKQHSGNDTGDYTSPDIDIMTPETLGIQSEHKDCDTDDSGTSDLHHCDAEDTAEDLTENIKDDINIDITENIKESLTTEEETPDATPPAVATGGEDPAMSLTVIQQPHFNREKSAISLLGEFNVRDKNGNDVTTNFSFRIKDLLILLILENERSSKGVRQQIIDELIWNDRDEKSAKNNRNVYMRKLRLLLSEIGNIEIIFDKGYYKIINENVTIDYSEIKKRLALLEKNSNTDNQLIDEILELLLYGTLLPFTNYPWLDNFKSDYSDKSLDMLFMLMKYVNTSHPEDERLIYRIAETVACHDPLSEEALEVKCRILAKRKIPGMAKKTYERFCKEYDKSFGQEFPRSFSEIVGNLYKSNNDMP